MESSVQQLVDRQNDLSASIQEALTNLTKLDTASTTRSALNARVNVVEKNWQEFVVNHRSLCNPDLVGHKSYRHFVQYQYCEIEEHYLEVVAALFSKIESLPSRTTAPIASDTTSTAPSNIKQLSRIDLPKFSGDFVDWINFRDLFISTVKTNVSLTDVERLRYLKSNTVDDAALLIANIPTLGENFKRAWQTLVDRYENKRLLLNAQLKALTSLRAVSSESATDLERLLNGTLSSRRALERLERPVKSWDDILVHLTVQKLDTASTKEWEAYIGARTDVPTFAELRSFLEARIQELKVSAAKSEVSASVSPHGTAATMDSELELHRSRGHTRVD